MSARDLSKVSARILMQNRATYARQLPSVHAAAQIDAIDVESARRAHRVPVAGGTSGYVLTTTGQFEHIAGERDGFTRCGAPIDHDRQHGNREWWPCLICTK